MNQIGRKRKTGICIYICLVTCIILCCSVALSFAANTKLIYRGTDLTSDPGSRIVTIGPLNVAAYSMVRLYVSTATGPDCSVFVYAYQGSELVGTLDQFGFFWYDPATKIYDVPGISLLIKIDPDSPILPSAHLNVTVYGR